MEVPLDLESPHDLAKQALAATGGKSTVKATEWILNKRAEVYLAHPSSLSFRRQLSLPPRRSPSAAAKTVSFHGEMAQKKAQFFRGYGEIAPILDQQKRAVLRLAIDYAGSSHFEKPASTGSCSRPSESREKQFPVKILKPKITVDPLKHSHLLDFGEIPKSQHMKTFHGLPVPENVSCKRQRQQDPEIHRAQPALASIEEILVHGLPVPETVRCKRQRQKYPEINRGEPSLAERMRPSSIDEILGQDHLFGPKFRALLDAECLPCFILYGPPGTGKTSLGRLLACPASRKVVNLSCTEIAETEIQDLLEEAKQAKKLGMSTVLFLETLQKFNRSQQEFVLSAIEAGCVGLIGTTVNNPSCELISALLSKCQVLTLKKLQPDDLMEVMERAMMDKNRGMLASISAFPCVDSVAIEDDALRCLADASNGDARLALDALEAAAILTVLNDKASRTELDANGLINKEITVSVSFGKERSNGLSTRHISTSDVLESLKAKFQFSQEEYVKPFKKIVGGQEVTNQNVSKEREKQKLDADTEGRFIGSQVGKDDKNMNKGRKAMVLNSVREKPAAVTITLAEVKEALRWAIENSGKNSQNLMVAMLQSMRGGDGNAAVYWLARVLENGENPLNVAQQLIIFASEDVGLADVNALVQAVSSYQACQLLGMPGCSLTLAQCVAYLSMAPKSTAVKDAILEVQKVMRLGRQETDLVPVHITDLVPVHIWTSSGSNELDHLPPSLKGHVFLQRPDPQLVSSESPKPKR